jgi:hypothetical protein
MVSRQTRNLSSLTHVREERFQQTRLSLRLACKVQLLQLISLVLSHLCTLSLTTLILAFSIRTL